MRGERLYPLFSFQKLILLCSSKNIDIYTKKCYVYL